MNRRHFLAAAAATPLGRCLLGAEAPFDPAREMSAILGRVRPLRFPDRSFDIMRYGARPGTQNSGGAIRQAIDACSRAGGGRVLVPAGDFLTGPVHLKSNVDLHLEKDATLHFSTDAADYLPLVLTRWEGTECMNYSPLLYAFGQTNIAVTGEGTLDGQADLDHWWFWKGNAKFKKAGAPNQIKARQALMAAGDRDVPVEKRVFGDGSYLRPPFVQPYRSTNVWIEGVAIRNSPFWELNPVLCRNVTVRNVTIVSKGPNNDGCNPDSSTDVLVEGCDFTTGDDCIAIKSGRNRDGRRVNVPAANIVIRNCRMRDGHGGVSLGSEISGGVRNVFVENCRMDSPDLERALRIKTNSYSGGEVENIYFRHNTVGQVSEAVIEVDYFYEEGKGGPIHPVVRNVVVENITSKRSKHALFFRGFPDAPISGVRVAHCNFENAAEPNVFQDVAGITIEDVTVNGKKLQSE
ncbi:MAG: glycoside hydrolase family 28 protein [Bryobacteraceae bacterium]